MGKRVTRYVDGLFDGVHGQLVALGLRAPDAGASSVALDFYLLLALASLFLSAYPLICYFTIARSPHTVFWLGEQPQHVCLLVPAALAAVMVVLLLLQQANMSQSIMKVMVLLLFCSAGAAMVVAAVDLMSSVGQTSESLMYRCGASGAMTQKVESEWERLHNFHQSCIANFGIQSMQVQKCPGFASLLLTPHALYAGYLEALESDFRCSGFCRFWALPLFNTRGVEAGRRCASSLGEEVGRVGYVIGLPVAASGAALMAVGFVLAGYDHL